MLYYDDEGAEYIRLTAADQDEVGFLGRVKGIFKKEEEPADGDAQA
jgi:hypothetical protein